MKKILHHAFTIVGIVIFIGLIVKTGPQTILDQISRIGLWMIPTFACSVAWNLLHTYAWYQFLLPLPGHISFKELFKIKVIGESVSAVTPVNFVAGDPARAYLLRHRFPMTESAASIVVDRTLHSIATLAMILIGTAAAFVELNFLPNNIKYGLPVVLVIAILFIGFVFVHQHKGLFIFIADIGRRLKIKKSFSSETLEKFEQVDGHIQDFYKKNRKGFWIALISHFIGRMLGILEIYIIGIAVTPIFTMKLAILLGAAVPIISFAFAFIPGTIGVLESAYTAILYFLNFQPSVGMTIQIVRRIRSIVWIGLGFLFLGVHNRKKILAQEA